MIIALSIHSVGSTTILTIAAIIKIIVKASLNCKINLSKIDCFCVFFNSFGPYFSRFSLTCLSVKPFFKSVENF